MINPYMPLCMWTIDSIDSENNATYNIWLIWVNLEMVDQQLQALSAILLSSSVKHCLPKLSVRRVCRCRYNCDKQLHAALANKCVQPCMCERLHVCGEFEFEWRDAYRTLGIQWHIELIHQHLDNIRMVSTNSQAQCIHAILWNHGGKHVHVYTYIYRAYNYADYSIVTVVHYSLQHSL